jgi:hypothetical protein
MTTIDEADVPGILKQAFKDNESAIRKDEMKEVFRKLREHLQCRANSLETKYPKGHDQRDGARTRIAEIEQTLMTLDAMESLRQQEQQE